MRVLHPLLLGKGATHKRSTLSNNSESDLIYSLPPPSDIFLTSIPTDLDSMFPRPSSPPLSHNSKSDIIYSFSPPFEISPTSSVPYAATVPRSRRFHPIPVPANRTNAKAAAYLSSHDVQDFVNSCKDSVPFLSHIRLLPSSHLSPCLILSMITSRHSLFCTFNPLPSY